MEYLKDINSLDSLPDAQIVERKVINGEKVALVFVIGPLARRLSGNPQDQVVVKLVSMDYIDTVEDHLTTEGYSVSRA